MMLLYNLHGMLQYLFSLLFIILAIIIAFYIPGRVVFGKNKSSNGIATVACSMIIGLVLWGWQGYIFGYLQMRFLSYIYLFIFILLFIYKKYYVINLNKLKEFDFPAIFLIILGFFALSYPYFKTGLITEKGIYFPPFSYATDHIGHTSLINEMVKRFPPFEPGMYGILVTNYHYWFNLITAELIRVFHLPLFQAQYIGMYIFGSLMLGVTAYVFSTSITKSKNFVRWLLFLLYFGGDASYWLSFITNRVFDFEIPSVIDYSALFMDNPPRAFSIIILFVALYLLFVNLKKLSKKDIVIISLLIGTLAGFKIYTGILALSGLGFLAVYNLFLKRDMKILGIFVLAFILSLIVFIPVNAGAGGIFFNPVDRPRDFITYQSLGLRDWELRWRVYLENNNYIRLIQYGIIMSVVYFFAQFGIRLIGLIPYKKMLLLLDSEKKIFIYGAMFLSFFVGLFFNQVANPSESYNFLIAGSFFLTVLTALSLSEFLSNKKLYIKIVIILVVAIITLPRFVYVQIKYVPKLLNGGFYGISNEEFETYNFLKNVDQKSLILVLNENNFDMHSPLVNTLTNKNMFLSGQRVLYDHKSINKSRYDAVQKIRETKNANTFMGTAKKNQIDYVYLYKNDVIKMNLKTIEKYKVFENRAAIIYKVN